MLYSSDVYPYHQPTAYHGTMSGAGLLRRQKGFHADLSANSRTSELAAGDKTDTYSGEADAALQQSGQLYG
jgi:hypothetical protein